MSDLKGRIALVTGSSSGIGAEVARRLAEAGAHVVVNSSSSVEAGERLAHSLATESVYVQADISQPEQVDRMIEATVDRYGGLDILVNNAGWTTVVDHADLEGLTDEIFDKTFAVNVMGTWRVTKAALPHLRNGTDPCVVTVTSVAGVRPVGSSIAYSMAKASLNQMTVLMAKSHGPVRFNAIAPGLIETPWTADWDQQHAAVRAAAPLGRVGRPEDVAQAVMSLIGNGYSSGAIWIVDGGLSQLR